MSRLSTHTCLLYCVPQFANMVTLDLAPLILLRLLLTLSNLKLPLTLHQPISLLTYFTTPTTTWLRKVHWSLIKWTSVLSIYFIIIYFDFIPRFWTQHFGPWSSTTLITLNRVTTVELDESLTLLNSSKQRQYFLFMVEYENELLLKFVIAKLSLNLLSML